MSLSLYYDACEYMDENLKEIEKYHKLFMKGDLNTHMKADLSTLIVQTKDNFEDRRHIEGYEHYAFNGDFLEQKNETNYKEFYFYRTNLTEEHRIEFEQKYGKYVELNDWGLLDIEHIRDEKSKVNQKYAVYRLNGVYEYLGDKNSVNEYKKQEEWYRFLDETLDANREIRVKLKNEFREDELEQRDKEMLGIVFIDAFLHKKRIDWEKWYRNSNDCYMSDQQQTAEEENLRLKKEETAKLCYQECEEMDTHKFKEQMKKHQEKPFFDLPVFRLTKDMEDLRRVRNIMLHMAKEYRETVNKLTLEYIEENNMEDRKLIDEAREKIKHQFKALTFGEVWEALSKKQRIDLEKWYKKEKDYYKPLMGKDV